MIALRPYQETAVNDIRTSFAAGNKSVLAVLPTGGGKCLAPGTPILMYDGTIKPVEEVAVGDLLMGPDSRPRKVLSTCTGLEEMYRVTPTKGDSYTVNKSHILSLKITGDPRERTWCGGVGYRGGDIANVTLTDYLAASKTFKHRAKGWRTGVEFEGSVYPLSHHPYFLGLWLGDGSSRFAAITTGDPEVKDWIMQYAKDRGERVRVEYNSENSEVLYIVGKHHTGRGGSVFNNALKAYGLIENKHIPHAYKTASRADRLQLLAGIIDTDGYYDRKQYTLTLKSQRLLDDVIFVARSLGFAAYKKEKTKTCTNNGRKGTYYTCNIVGDIDQIPVIIPRKKAAPRRQKKSVLVTGITVEPIGFGRYYGFEIDGDRLFLLGDFTATHNTVIFSHIAANSSAKGKRVLILVHRIELLRQTAKALQRAGINAGLVNPKYTPNYRAPVQVAMVQTMVKRTMYFPAGFDLIITDECFVPGTLIDGVPIEQIRPGDTVTAFNEQTGEFEQRRVVRTFKNINNKPLFKVTAGDKEIICTGNHPIYTDRGWIRADHLYTGANILTYELPNLQQPDNGQKKDVFGALPTSGIIAHNEPNEQGALIAQDALQQPYEGERNTPESIGETSRNTSQAESAGWKREGYHPTATGTFGAHPGCNCRVCNPDKNGQIFGVSQSLQTGYCDSIGAVGDRGGREFTLRPGAAAAGREENGVPAWHRVGSLEVFKPGSVEWNAAMRGEYYVYNFEVEGLHTYIANGIVAHNCHHIVSNTYRQILDAFPTAYQLGVTATPVRGDGKGLGRDAGGVFDCMVIGPTVAQLIAGGFLVKPVIYAPKDKLDLTGVRTKMGDYDKGEVERRVDKPSITGNAVEHYRKLMDGEPAVAFCVSVKHAQNVAAEFQAAGYRAYAVDGDMDDSERSAILGGLATGKVQVVTSCDIISEGTDIPAIAGAILLRPTKSTGLYLQQVGRALRTMPGKSRAIILDHVGNVLTHGLPDEDREWSLDGEVKDKKKKKDKEDTGPKAQQCPECYAMFEAAAHQCPECGWQKEKQAHEVAQNEGDLREITDAEKLLLKRQQQREVGAARTLEDLQRIEKERRYKSGWAKHIWNARQGKAQGRAELSNNVKL